MQHSTSVWIHTTKAKHTPKTTALVVFKALCTLYMKPLWTAKWSNCAKIHALCTGNKALLTQKFDLSRMCTTQSRETCALTPALSCHLFFSGKKKTQNTAKYDIFSVLSVPVWRSRPTKIRISVSQQHSKLRFKHEKGRFYETSATCPECASIRLVRFHSSAHTARKRKTWWKAQVRCYIRIFGNRTSNQDGLLHDPTVSKVTYNPQITKLPWTTSTTSRMCTAVPRTL